jgi:hypothetical protein
MCLPFQSLRRLFSNPSISRRCLFHILQQRFFFCPHYKNGFGAARSEEAFHQSPVRLRVTARIASCPDSVHSVPSFQHVPHAVKSLEVQYVSRAIDAREKARPKRVVRVARVGDVYSSESSSVSINQCAAAAKN